MSRLIDDDRFIDILSVECVVNSHLSLSVLTFPSYNFHITTKEHFLYDFIKKRKEKKYIIIIITLLFL